MINTLIHTDTRYPINRKVIRKAVEETLKKNKASGMSSEVSVTVVGVRKMRELSGRYLDDGDKHQILSFAYEDVFLHQSGEGRGFINPPGDTLRLGDIVLCWPEVLKEASRDDMMVDDEVYDLICHGVEHLLGKHHD